MGALMATRDIIWFNIIDPIINVAGECTGTYCGTIYNESASINSDLIDKPSVFDPNPNSGGSSSDLCHPNPQNIHEHVKQVVLIPLTILILGCNIGVLSFLGAIKKFHTPAYFLIANLGIADLSVGFVSIGTMITKSSEKTLDLCLIRIGFTVAFCIASILCLMCIAIERYIAITYSLTYKKMVTKFKAGIAITIAWFVSLLIGFAPLFGWRVPTYNQYCSFLYVLPHNYILFLFVSCALLPIAVMLFIYGKIYKNVRIHIKRIEAIENLHIERKNSGPLGMSARTWKSVKTLMAVFGCVLVTWLPFLFTTVAQIICGDTACYLKDIVGTHLLVLGFSNSFLNPLIYAIGTKEFRDKVKGALGRTCNHR